MPESLALLHTSPVHVPTFGALLAELAPEVPIIQHVDASLLEQARQAGLQSAALAQRMQRCLDILAEQAAVILCTCSTLGALAEQRGRHLGAEVLRIDRAMAEAAVSTGSKIVVVAALESTLEPTRLLLEETARQQGREVLVSLQRCEGAWTLFEQGDLSGYLAAVVSCLDTLPGDPDAVVLAQASMAGAASSTFLTVPVLSSPRLGVSMALRAYRAATGLNTASCEVNRSDA